MTTRTTAGATQQQAWPDEMVAGPRWAAASNSPAAPSARPADDERNLAFMAPASPGGPADRKGLNSLRLVPKVPADGPCVE
jgi:hypothetical protein